MRSPSSSPSTTCETAGRRLTLKRRSTLRPADHRVRFGSDPRARRDSCFKCMTTRDDSEVDYPDAITRLLSDYRTLSPSGVERIAHAWRRRGEMAAGGEGAERAARGAAGQAGGGPGKSAAGGRGPGRAGEPG